MVETVIFKHFWLNPEEKVSVIDAQDQLQAGTNRVVNEDEQDHEMSKVGGILYAKRSIKQGMKTVSTEKLSKRFAFAPVTGCEPTQ